MSSYRRRMDVVEVTPRLHFLRFPIGHAYLWRDSDGLTLIDTGVPGSGSLIAEAIRGLGHHPADLRRVVLTHFHGDHTGAAAEIVGWGTVTVYAHYADAPFIRGEAAGPPPDLTDWERPIFEQVQAQAPGEPPAPVRVDRELHDGDVLDFGEGAQAVAAPGHTPGSVAIYLPGSRVLFTGDTVARTHDGQIILGVFNADPAQAAGSFRRLAALDTEIACFGHGEPLTRGAAASLRAAAGRLP
jgi:glyoxylase-like metal-dependent hydrolase (beta-lactamase superfamily II)